MPAAKYNISVDQGSSFALHFQYTDKDDAAVNLSGYSARMQVRRSTKTSRIILDISTSGVTGGGTTGEFVLGGGISGTGGIFLNASLVGATGASGTTGGIYVSVNSESMANVPEGRHLYDMELTNAAGKVQRLVEGAFEVLPEVTKTV